METDDKYLEWLCEDIMGPEITEPRMNTLTDPDDKYLDWLYGLVAVPGIRAITYHKLMYQLFTTEFVWLPEVPDDVNRVEDGKALRRHFVHQLGLEGWVDPDWVSMGCSMLELMVGLADRLVIQAGGELHYWFWVLAKNIGLDRYSDDRPRYMRKHIEDILNDVIYRQYRKDGRGGFFPLKHPNQDQRKVELWIQLGAYVMELSEQRGG